MFSEQSQEIIQRTYHPDSPQVMFIEMNEEDITDFAEDESLKAAIESVQTDIHTLNEEIEMARRNKAHDEAHGLQGGGMKPEEFSKVKRALQNASLYLEDVRNEHTQERGGISRDSLDSLEEEEEIIYSMVADQNIWGAKRLDSTGDPRLNYVSDISQDILSFLSELYEIETGQIDPENIERDEFDYGDKTFKILDHTGHFSHVGLDQLKKDYSNPEKYK
jgi:hypothetical protein